MAPKAKKKAKSKAKAAKLSAAEQEAKNKIIEDFRVFDLNGDGLLQRGELKALLKVLDPSHWTDDSVDRLVIAFDKDGDGDISLEEFVDWITGGAGDADHSALTETLERNKTDVAAANMRHAQQELAHLKGVNIAAEVRNISEKELERVAQVAVPSEPLQRLLALVWLLLQPSTTKATGRAVNFNPPAWSVVQHLLQDSSFLQRVGRLDERQKEMKVTNTVVATRAVEQYFCLPESGEGGLPPLSYSSLLEANQSHKLGKTGPVLTLYKWCLTLLESNLRVLARDRLREEAAMELQREQEREHAEKVAAMSKDSEALLAELDDLLAES